MKDIVHQNFNDNYLCELMLNFYVLFIVNLRFVNTYDTNMHTSRNIYIKPQTR